MFSLSFFVVFFHSPLDSIVVVAVIDIEIPKVLDRIMCLLWERSILLIFVVETTVMRQIPLVSNCCSKIILNCCAMGAASPCHAHRYSNCLFFSNPNTSDFFSIEITCSIQCEVLNIH